MDTNLKLPHVLLLSAVVIFRLELGLPCCSKHSVIDRFSSSSKVHKQLHAVAEKIPAIYLEADFMYVDYPALLLHSLPSLQSRTCQSS